MKTLEDLIVERRTLRALTKARYVRAVRSFEGYVGSDPRAWTPDSARRWVDHLERSKLKPQSVNVYVFALRSASKMWAMHHQDPRHNFAAGLERLPCSEAPVSKHALTYEQAQACIDACRGDAPADLRDFAMMTLGFKTGMRRMSLAALEVERIDWSSRTIEIFVKRGRYHEMPPLDEGTFEALEPWRAWLRHRGISSGRLFRGMPGLAPLGTQGGVRESITGHGIYGVLSKRAKRAEVGEFTPHTFRHTFVSWMQHMGQPSYVIQAYTGHRSDAMIGRYTHVSPDDLPPMAAFRINGAP